MTGHRRAGTASSSSAVGSEGCSPPRPCAGHRSTWSSSTAPVTTCSSRCSTRLRPASCPKDRSPGPCEPSSPGKPTPPSSSERSTTSTSTSSTVSSTAFDTTTVTPYDSLVVAAGAGYSYFGHDDFTPHAPGPEVRRRRPGDPCPDLRRVRACRQARDDEERRRHLTFAVIGGGPTGIEMAGQIRDLARRSLHSQLRLHRPRAGPRRALRSLPLPPPHLRPEAVAAHRRSAEGRRRRRASRRPGARRRTRLHHLRAPWTATTSSTPAPRSGPPASRPAR